MKVIFGRKFVLVNTLKYKYIKIQNKKIPVVFKMIRKPRQIIEKWDNLQWQFLIRLILILFYLKIRKLPQLLENIAIYSDFTK